MLLTHEEGLPEVKRRLDEAVCYRQQPALVGVSSREDLFNFSDCGCTTGITDGQEISVPKPSSGNEEMSERQSCSRRRYPGFGVRLPVLRQIG